MGFGGIQYVLVFGSRLATSALTLKGFLDTTETEYSLQYDDRGRGMQIFLSALATYAHVLSGKPACNMDFFTCRHFVSKLNKLQSFGSLLSTQNRVAKAIHLALNFQRKRWLSFDS